MNAIDTSATLDAMLAFLTEYPWLNDPKAGKNAAKFQFMCMAGLHIGETDDGSKYGKMQFTGEFAEKVIAIAQGNAREAYLAHEALYAVADDLTSRKKPLRLTLQRYILATARGQIKRKKGGSILSNIMRDDAIYHAVQIGVKSGLKATRNEATDKDSGCTIAREALKRCKIDLTESEVTTIYKNRRRAHKKAWLAAGNSEKNFK